MSAVSHSSLQHDREGLAGRWQTNVWLPGASTLYWQMWTNCDSSFCLHQALGFLRQSLFLLGCLTGLALEVCSPLAEIRHFLVKQGLHQEKTSALEQLPFAHTTKQNVYITDSVFAPKTASQNRLQSGGPPRYSNLICLPMLKLVPSLFH